MLIPGHLLTVLDGADGDFFLDVTGVDAFDDAALAALTSARSRAMHARRRIVVRDRDGGVVTAALRRSGLLSRFHVHRDLAGAVAQLDGRQWACRRSPMPW